MSMISSTASLFLSATYSSQNQPILTPSAQTVTSATNESAHQQILVSEGRNGTFETYLRNGLVCQVNANVGQQYNQTV